MTRTVSRYLLEESAGKDQCISCNRPSSSAEHISRGAAYVSSNGCSTLTHSLPRGRIVSECLPWSAGCHWIWETVRWRLFAAR